MEKLVLIDGNAILHRAYHALPPLNTKSGEPINAVYGLVSMLLRVIQDLKPTQIAVAFDESAPTFRHKEFKEYQAQRPKMDNELSSQFEKARRVIAAFGIPAYSKPGFEADDVIGTLATKASEVPTDVVVVTGDRDQLQLVNDRKNVKLYMPVVGLSNAKLYGEVETKERMGVLPNLIDDYKALVGDPSDNYGGVSGIGPKTAIKLLEDYGSFENVYKNLDKISDRVREKLVAGEAQGRMSKRLATIVRNVPIEYNFDEMGKWKVNSPEVLNLFSEFGFKTLTERVKEVGKKIEEEKQTSLF